VFVSAAKPVLVGTFPVNLSGFHVGNWYKLIALGCEAENKARVDRMIYGTKIIPLLKLKTATTITTISAGTTFKSFIPTRYCCADIVSVQNCTMRLIRLTPH
jgi:hypothetical protein